MAVPPRLSLRPRATAPEEEKPYRPVPMYRMSVREVRGRASLTLFIDRVIDGGPDTVTAPDDALSVRDNPI